MTAATGWCCGRFSTLASSRGLQSLRRVARVTRARAHVRTRVNSKDRHIQQGDPWERQGTRNQGWRSRRIAWVQIDHGSITDRSRIDHGSNAARALCVAIHIAMRGACAAPFRVLGMLVPGGMRPMRLLERSSLASAVRLLPRRQTNQPLKPQGHGGMAATRSVGTFPGKRLGNGWPKGHFKTGVMDFVKAA